MFSGEHTRLADYASLLGLLAPRQNNLHFRMIALLAESWHRDDKFAVFLGDKILGRIG
jgi:ABC-type antimicrobial peptide transport system permease subunit